MVALAWDGDDSGRNNFPDDTNNHKSDGWNWLFADMHVEWIKQEETEQTLIDANQKIYN